MTKSELRKKLASKFVDFEQSDIDAMLDIILHEIIHTGIYEGGGMEVRGFGSFTLQTHEGRMVRNPKTGSSLFRPASHYLHFRPGRELNHRINQFRKGKTTDSD